MESTKVIFQKKKRERENPFLNLVILEQEFNMMLKKRENWHPPYTTAEPEVLVKPLSFQDSFMILATDGLWDFISSEEAVKIVGQALVEKKDINLSTLLTAKMFDKAISRESDLTNPWRRQLFDDTTVTVVIFRK